MPGQTGPVPPISDVISDLNEMVESLDNMGIYLTHARRDYPKLGVELLTVFLAAALSELQEVVSENQEPAKGLTELEEEKIDFMIQALAESGKQLLEQSGLDNVSLKIELDFEES